MSFKECLETYMKDKNSDEDIKFIAEINKEHEQETANCINNMEEHDNEVRKQERERIKNEIFGTIGNTKTGEKNENKQTIDITIDDLFKNIK